MTALLLTFFSGIEAAIVLSAAPAIAIPLLLLTSAVLTYLQTRTRDFAPGPPLSWLGERARSEAAAYDPRHLILQVGAAMQEAYAGNQAVLARKVRLLRLNTLVFLTLLIFCLLLAVSAGVEVSFSNRFFPPLELVPTAR